MKKWISLVLTTVLALSLVACGSKKSDVKLEGSVSDILGQVYENAELDPGLVEAMQYFDQGEITPELAETVLGTDDVEFTEGVYSMPMMSAQAYQCVLLRLPEGADVEEAKQTLLDNADPRKWVCVEAESVIVENVGDVGLFLMSDSATGEAIKTSFLALGK